jgi:hypothetical protein
VSDSRRLQQLVDDRRYDELLREVTLDDIAETWVRYQRREPTVDEPWENHPDSWAVDLWMDNESPSTAWWSDEARVRAGILAIVEAADPEDEGIIGAAIMEVFVNKDDDRIAWLEEQARNSERFRGSLANLWLGGDVPDPIFERAERAAGVPLVRLGPPWWRRA